MDYGYYDYGYGYEVADTVSTGLGAVFGFLAFMYIIALAVGIFSIICNWKVFKKAGKQGWEAIVPIYNIVVLLQVAGCPLWYIALFFLPIANVVVMFLIYIELAKKFGQSTGFGIGLVFLNPIFMAMLAFGKKYVYQGQVAMNQQSVMQQQPMMNQQPINQQPVNQQPMNQQPMMNQQPVQPVSDSINQMVPPTLQQTAQTCSKCGAAVNPGDKFCMSCGNQL